MSSFPAPDARRVSHGCPFPGTEEVLSDGLPDGTRDLGGGKKPPWLPQPYPLAVGKKASWPTVTTCTGGAMRREAVVDGREACADDDDDDAADAETAESAVLF